MDKITTLSKSVVLSHRQCPRRAWLESRSVVAPEHSRTALMLQEQGQRVHEAARGLFDAAVRVPASFTMGVAAAHTAQALAAGAKQVIEAGFVAESLGLGVRVDVLEALDGGVGIVEVKSGGSVKDEYLDDVAVQYACLTEAGENVRRVEVMHPSTAMVRQQGGSEADVLVRENVTDEVHYRSMKVVAWVKACRETVEGAEPNVEPGEQCSDPHPCPFAHHCGEPSKLDDPDRVEWLPSKAEPVKGYIDAGIARITDLPMDAFEHPRNALVHLALVLDRAVVTEELAEAVRSMPYPRHYIDFEAVSLAVPRFDGMRAHQAMAFQWSCHREDAEGAPLVHTDFLDVSGKDPRRAFAETLVEAVGTDGAVVVYSSYERTRIKELAVMFPDLRVKLMAVCDRIVDLLPLARRGYYAPAMLGSWSLKAIAPTLPPVAGVDEYADLDGVADGMEAQAAYIELTDERRVGIDRDAMAAKLRRYCGTDTAGLYRFVRAISSASTRGVPVGPKAAKRAAKKAAKAAANSGQTSGANEAIAA